MDCNDKRSLRRRYTLYVRAYSDACNKLIALSRKAKMSESDSAWDLTDRARLLCLDTLNKLKRHIAGHGCGDE